MTVKITLFAKSELRKIYDYYAEAASHRIALQIVERILNAALSLNSSPERGTLEENLIELNQEHRYLVCGNYKIIYFIKDNLVFVTDIFDCRQNPEKMKIRSEE